MKIESQHTPTPWTDKAGEIYDAEGHVVLLFGLKTPDVLENRARVVRAVNAHDELVVALKQARESYVYRTRHENKVVGEGDTLLSVIDAALSKAEGK
jgi:hypothetical protein